MILSLRKKTLFFSIIIIALILLSLSTTVLNKQNISTLNNNSDSISDNKDYIKWVDFNVCLDAMKDTFKIDVESQKEEIKINWIDLLSYLGAKYGGDFSKYKSDDINPILNDLKSGKTIKEITSNMKYFDYYNQAYNAVLSQFVGNYKIQVPSKDHPEELIWEEKYGLKAFSPIAKTFPYEDYDDFGASRSYGFKRQHLGHDLLAATGTPVIAVESGTVEVMGWNQYGGWRVGIRSFDKKRYYYYAHLRQNRPYHVDLAEGKVVNAGDVIGYVGRTGYSVNENVNNINKSHLHLGLQLIFDESQKECNNEIWINLYPLTQFLEQNRSEVYRVSQTKEFYRKYQFEDLDNKSQSDTN